MLNLTFVEDPDLGIYKPQDLEYEKTFFPFILISKNATVKIHLNLIQILVNVNQWVLC